MKKPSLAYSFFAVLILITTLRPAAAAISATSANGNFLYTFSGSFKPEMFYGENINWLNKNDSVDKFWYMRHTLDTKIGLQYGAAIYQKSVVNCQFTFRNKGIWANPQSIASTTESQLKANDSVIGYHKHAIPYHIVWLREGWLKLDLTAALGCNCTTEHSFTIGFFPWELGWGITLGNAYLTGPDLLGFYTDSNINQFAPAALLHGELIHDVLEYDLYAALLNNKTSSYADTGERILGQQYGRRLNPERGSGKLNYLVAARLRWQVFNNDECGALTLEPYGLFNNDPEQKVEFLGDASSRMGTIGFSTEYIHKRFEWGFDCAFNVGNQKVKGWDRNQVELSTDLETGFFNQINTKVIDQNKAAVRFNKKSVIGKKIQEAIDKVNQDKTQNGQPIAEIDGLKLINASNRFRNPYTNTFEGWMFVSDAAVRLYKKDLQLAAAVGVASGDDNPNNETRDSKYSGFIGLQEIFSGKRVKSAFLMSGAGKIRRPLSTPTENQMQAPEQFAQSVSGFTNLVFTGAALTWTPSSWENEISVNGNIIGYWQEKPTRKFDAFERRDLPTNASTFLGIETNVFAHYYIFKDLRLYFVGSMFFPGTHYRDIRGKPLNSAQARVLEMLLEQLDRSGLNDRIPNISNNIAFTGNIGLEIKF